MGEGGWTCGRALRPLYALQDAELGVVAHALPGADAMFLHGVPQAVLLLLVPVPAVRDGHPSIVGKIVLHLSLGTRPLVRGAANRGYHTDRTGQPEAAAVSVIQPEPEV